MGNLFDESRLARWELEFGKLIARRRHRKAAQLVDPHKYAEDPVGFALDVLHEDPAKLWGKQREMLELVRDHPLVAVKGANGVGKDHVAAILAMWWCYARDGLVIITGTTQRQVSEILFGRELRGMFARSGLEGIMLQHALRFEDVEEEKRGIFGFVSDDIAKLSGHHSPQVLCIISEAQGVEDFVFDAMFGNAVGADDRILVEGNPLAPVGPFYGCFRPNSGWAKLTITALEHPNVVTGTRVIAGPMERAAVARIEKRYGAGSPYWLGHVLAEFPEVSTDSIFTPALITAAAAKYATGWRGLAGASYSLVLAWDVAAAGDDFNCVAVWQGPCWLELELWQDPDLMSSAARVEQIARRWGMKKLGDRPAGADPLSWGVVEGKIVVDTTGSGLGKGPVARLRELGWEVEEFDLAGKAPAGEEGRWRNLRAWAHFFLRDRMAAGEVAGPIEDELREEMLAARYLLNTGEGVQLVPKKEIRAALGRSPDRLDAVVMGGAVSYESATIGGEVGNFGF